MQTSRSNFERTTMMTTRKIDEATGAEYVSREKKSFNRARKANRTAKRNWEA